MAKFRTGKVSYIIDGERSNIDMAHNTGAALMTAARTNDINDIIGETSVVCLKDGSLFLCEVKRGRRSGSYDLSVCDKLVMKDAAVEWAEPIIVTFPSGEWQRIQREDPEEYYRRAASDPVPVLYVSEGGRAKL